MAVRSLKDPELRRLRALGMIDMRIRGKTIREVAEEFGVSDDTVTRTLSWAKKADLIVQAEDRILREIVPAAQAAILAVLQGTDDEVKAKTALEIFKGTLPSFAKAKPSTGATAHGPDSDLSSYINALRNDLAVDGEVLGGDAPALDGGDSPLQIPARAESVAAEGVSAPSAGHESAADAPGNPGVSE